MRTNQVYSMTDLIKSEDVKNAALFLLTYDNEKRSYYSWNYLNKNGSNYKNVIILTYDEENLNKNKDLKQSIMNDNVIIYPTPNDQDSFVQCIQQIDFKNFESIIIDISSMRTIHIFLLLKYLKLNNISNLKIINTIPYDYIFNEEPFLSYHSYHGDLKLVEIFGYSGKGEMPQDNDLFIFLGFEGSLSSKVVEDTAYKNLYLINTIPSYYQKYKDISIINNDNIMQEEKILLHSPADNPFEVYNILDLNVQENTNICIAPLSTKPISLGICLYALEHENVRIVYPVSENYNVIKSHDIYTSYVYEINLKK